MDTIKVEALVQEFLAAQSLKVLPQAPFGDAVNQFVSKDDKHAMETFVSESLAGQVKNLLSLDPDEDSLDTAMERVRAKLDAQFAAGQLKIARRRRFKPKPDDWDSDLDGHWEDNPEALANPAEEEAPTPPGNGRARGRAAQTLNAGDDDISMDDAEEEEAPVRKAPARRGAAARTTKAAPGKKAPAAKMPPARGGRKKILEDDDDEDEDMFVAQDEEEEEEEAPAPPPPKRAPAKRAQPARSTAKAPAKTPARQTKLNFTQSQKPAAGSTQQKALEISDDEISEDDDFETMPTTRSRRR